MMDSLIDNIAEKAKSLNLDIQNKSENSISIWASPSLGIALHIKVEGEQKLSFYFHHRTNSSIYNGSRSDIHDIISLLFAICLKKLELCSLGAIDMANPATGDDVEIYLRYLIPEQIHPGLLNTKHDDYQNKIESLILSLVMFEYTLWNCFEGCPCSECRKRLNYAYDYTYDVDRSKIDFFQDIIGASDLIDYGDRTLPNWFYYRDAKHGISLLDSPELIPLFNGLAEEKKPEKINGIGGQLVIESHFTNYISSRQRRKIENYFLKLKDSVPKLLFLENKVIAVGQKYVLINDYNCGLHTFKIAKEKLRERHEKEFRTLFKPSTIQWSDKIDDSQFENLIKDLLEREYKVVRVRKVSHTRERDGGTDLIAEWLVPQNINSQGKNPDKKINVIVQCKAFNDGVSKSKVTDIRDTVESRSYDGYFLAVSSYLKKSLSDHLDKMRTENKIWVDWWGRDEIDNRLKQHRDLLIKYSDIVSINE